MNCIYPLNTKSNIRLERKETKSIKIKKLKIQKNTEKVFFFTKSKVTEREREGEREREREREREGRGMDLDNMSSHNFGF